MRRKPIQLTQEDKALIYVLSDIHGQYGKYRAMLQTISLRPDDTLYVLGDVVDRGPDPMKVLKDMMSRANVIPILGNHDFMAAYCLHFLVKNVTDETVPELDGVRWAALQYWFRNGGQSTFTGFLGLSPEDRADILEYLDEFSLYGKVSVAGKDYVLVHAGLGNFSPDRPLENYMPDELISVHTDYDRPYYPEKYVVTGHTPTQIIPGNPNPGRIFRKNNHIAIDCGCTFGGPLGAICLNTGEEFYI